jgi:hypothetical protein
MPVQKGFNAVMFPADKSGCGFYRMTFPTMALQTIARDIRVIDSMKLIADPKFFRDIRVVRLQRQVNDAQCGYFLNFLKPLSQSIGFWIVYEIDDVISYDDIPKYNIGRHAFKNENFFRNIRNMLDASDFITVTTEELKDYYVNKYSIEESKFIVIPNYLPRWWAGESFNLREILENYIKNSKKPRIGFPVSSSHFDLEGRNNYQDDFTHICDMIKRTYEKYQYVFIGGYPQQLQELVDRKKIEVHRGSDLLNYPRELYAKDLQLVIAPLMDNTFNRCKSNIKLLESWALGIPVYAQNLPCYNKYTDMVFNNGDDLEIKINNFLNDSKKFKKTVKKNRDAVDYNGKLAPRGWWLEKNLQQWYNIFAIPQKTLELNLTQNKETLNEIKLEL